MKSRLMAAAAIGAAALAAVAGCGSSSGSSASSSGKVTLTFFGADYGTGPSNSTTKYWDAVATAFHQAHPSITVNVQTVNWTDFPTKSATLIQNKQYPDIMEGNPAPPYAQSGLIYPVSDVLSPSVASNLIPKFLKDGQYPGHVLQQEDVRGGRHLRPAEDVGRTAGRRGQDQGQGRHRLRHAPRQRGGAGRVAAVVPRQRRRLPELRREIRHQQPAEHRHAELHEADGGLG